MALARILAIDDDPVIGLSLGGILHDYELTVVETGEEGLAFFEDGRFEGGRVQAAPFDLVICDLMLPGIDGMEVIQRIRALRPSQRVMVLSADDRSERLISGLRANVVDFVVKPFDLTGFRTTVANILANEAAIEVLSATPQWIELLIPASFQVAESLTNFLATLHTGIDESTRYSIGMAFRELINNAIEHGARGDAKQRIHVSCARMQRSIIYRIDDPGPGFDVTKLPHAAVSYPGDPIHHVAIREEQGLRPGGYGMLWTQTLADEVIYNERRNKVMFVKYLM